MENFYALYKGDELLSLGTIKQISKEMNILESSVRFFGNKTYLERTKGSHNRKILIKIENDPESQEMQTGMYTVKEAAKLLRYNKEYLRQKLQKGEIDAIKIGKKWMVKEETIKKILQQ